MNPLVKDMLEATISNDVETRLLEDLFEHEAKCESETHDMGRVQCSGDVTYLLTALCLGPRKVCKSMGRRAQHYIVNARRNCGVCGISVQKCWTIRPI